MIANTYQRILGAIKQGLEITRFSIQPVPIPIRVQIHESEHHLRMSIREYQNLNQKRNR